MAQGASDRPAIAPVLAGLAILAAAVVIGGSAAATSSTAPLAADAHVRADQAGANFGTASSINLGGRPISNGYLRFDVSVPAGETVTKKATLRLYATPNKSGGFTAHGVTDDVWDENAINYGNSGTIGCTPA